MAKSAKQPTSLLQRVPKWALAGFIIIFAAIGVYAIALSQAAPKGKPGTGTTPAQLYLTTATDAINKGDNFTVLLRFSPLSPVDGVQSTITYNASQLGFVSIDSTGSAFPAALQEEGGNGVVKIARGTFAPEGVSGDSLVSTVTFKALQTTRNSSLQLTNSKATMDGQYATDPTTSGLTLRIR